MLSIRLHTALAVAAFSTAALTAAGQTSKPAYPDYPSETPAKLEPATESFDYARREAMIPMRDG